MAEEMTRQDLLKALNLDAELMAQAEVLRMGLSELETVKRAAAAAPKNQFLTDRLQRLFAEEKHLSDLEQLIGELVCDRLLAIKE